MGNCSYESKPSSINVSLTPKSSEQSPINSIVTTEFSHSFNPSKLKSDSSNIIMNIFLKQDTIHSNSNDTLTSDESYCLYDNEILSYFEKDNNTLQRFKTKSSIAPTIKENDSKEIKGDFNFKSYRTFLHEKVNGNKFSFNMIPNLPEELKQEFSSEIPFSYGEQKKFIRKNAMRYTKLLRSDALPNYPKKTIKIVNFNEELAYKVLSTKNKTLNDRHLLFRLLQSISFLYNIRKDIAYEIIEDLQYVQIESKTLIIKANSIGNHIFFIKKGSIKICPSNMSDMIYETRTAPLVIGERILINDRIRQWDVYSVTPIYGYVLRLKGAILTMRNNLLSQRDINRSILDKTDVLSELTDEQKDRLSTYMVKEVYREKASIINSYEQPQSMFILVNGSATNISSTTKELILPGNIFSYNNLIYNKNISTSIKTNKECICLSFTYECLENVFNDENYHIRMRNIFIKSKLSQDNFFRTICPMIDNTILNNFSMKFYSQGSIIIERGSIISDYIYVILEGDVCEENEPRLKLKEKFKSPVLYSEDVFNGISKEMNVNLKAYSDCFIAKIRKKTMIFHMGKTFENAQCMLRRKNVLGNTRSFNKKVNIDKNIIDSVCENFDEVTYCNINQVIYKRNDIAEKVFIVAEGEVEIITNEVDEKYDIITKGKFSIFGLNSICSLLSKDTININSIKLKYNEKAIVSQTNTVLYSISREKYIECFNDRMSLLLYMTRRVFYLENNFDIQKMYYLPIKNLQCISQNTNQGRIFLVRKNLFDEQVCFLRVYHKSYYTNEQLFNEFPKISKLIKACDNHFITKIINISLNLQYIFYLFPYVNGCALSSFIYNNKSFNLNYNVVKFISIQLFLAVRTLHQNQMIHRLINPNNIIIDSNGYLKITHMISLALVPLSKSSKLEEGDVRYKAPEMLYGNNEYSYAVDYWSIGIIMYVIISKKFPFNIDMNENDTITSIINDDLQFPSNVINEDFKDIVSKLLDKREERRMKSWEEVVNHPFFKDYNIKAIETLSMEAPSELKGRKGCVNPYKNEKYITYEEINKQIYKEDENLNKELSNRKQKMIIDE